MLCIQTGKTLDDANRMRMDTRQLYVKSEDAVLTVVSPRELFKLQELIHATDPNAFITINEVREVRGRGFSLQKEYH